MSGHGEHAGGGLPPLGPTASITVVIPTLNEAANLPHVLARIPAIVDEVVIVDGHSIDDTVAVARAIRPGARIVLQERFGKGDALACGFAAATCDIIVTLDADGSTDPAEIPLFVQTLLDGSDFAKGSRFVGAGGSRDITPVRRLGNHVLRGFANALYRTRYTDLCYGYNAFWRHCLPDLHPTCRGFEIEALINVRAARSGLVVTEVGSVEHGRLHGSSNLSAVRDGVRVLSAIVAERVRRHRPAATPQEWRPSFRELAPEELGERSVPAGASARADARDERPRGAFATRTDAVHARAPSGA